MPRINILLASAHMGSLTLVGRDVFLVSASEQYAKEIIACVQQYPDVPRRFAFFAGNIPSVEEETEYLRRMRRSAADELFLICKMDGELIGTCGLHDVDPKNRTARLGIILFNPYYHGRGFGSDALNRLLRFAFNADPYAKNALRGMVPLHKVYLNVFSDNEAGEHLYVSLGFQFEARLRREYRRLNKDGEEYFVDLIRLSILREEWLARNPKEDEE